MEVKVNAGTLTTAIPDQEIVLFLELVVERFQASMNAMIRQFDALNPTADKVFSLENQLHDRLRELGRNAIEWLFSRLEPATEHMPGTVSQQGKPFRQLASKSIRSDIVTRFGKISLCRARYRRGRAGKTIFPLELLLGIENGFTPAAADRIGKQFAACGSSQGRTLEMIEDQTGAKIGTEKLRGLIKTLADGLEPLREAAQVKRLLEWIMQAREQSRTPVLSVSRDGVALGLAPWSFFEMASVACVSVLVEGRKLGTVYLGNVPEPNQATLSAQLTSLLTATVRACGDRVPEIVYVSDAGKVESTYWKECLRKFFVDGVRIKITRVVDYYHAAERLTTIADALKFGQDKRKRHAWLDHVRWLLLQPGGHGRMLRSITAMRKLHGFKQSAEEDAAKAERYLRRYRQFMDYAGMKSRGFPIGSGVVESACKQIVSERMKLSGMRWHKAGGQRTMTLRCLLLSGIWDAVYTSWLVTKPTVIDLMNLKT